MQKKVFYWSPFLNYVGTVKSTINSAVSIKKYSDSKFNPIIINCCGEWNNYLNLFKKNDIEVINFFNKGYYNLLPKQGFLGSRFSYIIIFLISFIPLLRLLKKNKNELFISHLITSLPLSLFLLFKIKNKLILRISGLPKLNFLRKKFWEISSTRIDVITCPSKQLLEKLIDDKIFLREKIYFLPDAIFQIKDLIYQKKNYNNLSFPKKKKIILSIGRLTKQKNFSYLINEFSTFSKNNEDFLLYILGDGEEKNKLIKLIKEKDMEKKVFLIGRVNNVFNYIKNSEIFILSSLWEDPGFVLAEAGLGNLFVISSDCPNGPKEILDYGKNGLLFKNNQKNDLANSINKYISLTENEKFSMKSKLKKNISKYSIFKHNQIFKRIFS